MWWRIAIRGWPRPILISLGIWLWWLLIAAHSHAGCLIRWPSIQGAARLLTAPVTLRACLWCWLALLPLHVIFLFQLILLTCGCFSYKMSANSGWLWIQLIMLDMDFLFILYKYEKNPSLRKQQTKQPGLLIERSGCFSVTGLSCKASLIAPHLVSFLSDSTD